MANECHAAEDLAQARRLFAQKCEFTYGVTCLEQMPVGEQDEIAFAGRSNVGKSSLLNALVGRKSLARSSTTPGRTRQINFFDLGHKNNISIRYLFYNKLRDNCHYLYILRICII